MATVTELFPPAIGKIASNEESPSLPITPPEVVLRDASVGPSTRAASTRASSPTRSFSSPMHNRVEEYELTTRLEALSGRQGPDRSFALPPVQGRQAWFFVMAAMTLETLIWGASNSFGVFQKFYASHPPFETYSPAAISLIGTLCMAMQYSSGIVLVPLYQKFPHLVWKMCFGGMMAYSILLILAGFATNLPVMIIIFLLVGLSGSAAYLPVILWLPEWFTTKKGLASGIVFSGSALGGLLWPYLAQIGLESLGYQWTLRIWGGISLFVGTVATLLTRPRVPLPSAVMVRNRSGRPILLNLGFKTKRTFLHTVGAIFVQSLGIACALLYIPTFAQTIGLTTAQGTLALALYNLAGVLGQISLGFVSDRISWLIVLGIAGLLQSFAAYLLWGFATNFALLITFSLAFGWVGGGSTAPWTVAATSIAGQQTDQIGPMFSCFAFGKGTASVIGPLIAGQLYKSGQYKTELIGLANNRYGVQGSLPLVVFVGSVGLLGGVIAISGFRREQPVK